MAAALTVTRLDTLWTDDPRLVIGHDLAARLRGAWGHRLLLADADGDTEATRARAVFFPDKLADSTGGHASPPYRIAAARGPAGLRITLALIGFAGRWRDAAFDALIAAVAGPPGLWLDESRRRSARLRLISAEWTRTEGVPVPPSCRKVALDFATPLRIGPDDALGTRFDNVIVGLAERAGQTGPWIGIAFEPRLSHWRDVAKKLRYGTTGLRPVVWDMYSSRNGRDRAAGYLGRLEIEDPPPTVMALLAAGTVLHAGRSPSKGCGRYDLIAPCL